MRGELAAQLRCPSCGGTLAPTVFEGEGESIREGILRCTCGRNFPVVAGVPRLLPDDLAPTLVDEQPGFFRRHPELLPGAAEEKRPASLSTLRAFGDEWRRFPELHAVHQRIFQWYFDGPCPVRWEGLHVLDAGCGMGRWLHFARAAGAKIVGMDVSPAIDVAAGREGVDLVQADLRHPPLRPGSFDLVYCLGVLHHLEEPLRGLRALASLVRPGGELRIYVYRSLDGEAWFRRALLGSVACLRRVTTRLPFWAVNVVATTIALVATPLFLWPRRLVRGSTLGERLTRGLPLVQYADVPFRMLVAEQFDRLVAPLEGRYRAEEVRAWYEAIGFDLVDLRPGLGWRAIGRRPFPGH